MVSGDSSERDFVIQTARDADVKFVRLWFPDILGNLKGFAINVTDLEDAIDNGVGFDGSAIEGFARDQRERHAGFSRPRHVYAVAVAPPAERGGPDVLRHQETQGRRFSRRPAAGR